MRREPSGSLGKAWVGVGKKLGVDVVSPATVTLASGASISADALVRGFGRRNGMLVIRNHEQVRRHVSELKTAGFGFSVLESPAEGEAIDIAEYIDLLRDWGWSGPRMSMPSWLRSNADPP
jgi:hypothetical protein